MQSSLRIVTISFAKDGIPRMRSPAPNPFSSFVQRFADNDDLGDELSPSGVESDDLQYAD